MWFSPGTKRALELVLDVIPKRSETFLKSGGAPRGVNVAQGNHLLESFWDSSKTWTITKNQIRKALRSFTVHHPVHINFYHLENLELWKPPFIECDIFVAHISRHFYHLKNQKVWSCPNDSKMSDASIVSLKVILVRLNETALRRIELKDDLIIFRLWTHLMFGNLTIFEPEIFVYNPSFITLGNTTLTSKTCTSNGLIVDRVWRLYIAFISWIPNWGAQVAHHTPQI